MRRRPAPGHGDENRYNQRPSISDPMLRRMFGLDLHPKGGTSYTCQRGKLQAGLTVPRWRAGVSHLRPSGHKALHQKSGRIFCRFLEVSDLLPEATKEGLSPTNRSQKKAHKVFILPSSVLLFLLLIPC